MKPLGRSLPVRAGLIRVKVGISARDEPTDT
jgi:hypothetical protein